jgi:hypothetical protein
VLHQFPSRPLIPRPDADQAARQVEVGFSRFGHAAIEGLKRTEGKTTLPAHRLQPSGILLPVFNE